MKTNQSIAPTWEDFCARVKQTVLVAPDPDDEEWQKLYHIYQLGYSSALEAVMKMLKSDNL